MKRHFCYTVVLALTFGLGTLLTGPVLAAEEVLFISPETPPTPFKMKQAAKKGIVAKSSPGIEIIGTLYMPKGDEPHPAVTILVGAGGVLVSHRTWAKELASWGYVALLVDSFGSRGGTNLLDTSALDMTVDAYAAYNYLSTRPEVDASRIGILGFSMGGSFVFPIMRDLNKQRPENVAYRAAVAFYPTCNLGYDYSKPIMVLFGDNDILASLGQCQNLVADNAAKDAVSLHVYKGASHFFDSTDYAKDSALRGEGWRTPLWFAQHGYDAEAAKDSIARTRAFLDANL